MSNISDIVESLGEDFLEDFSANIHSELETIEQHIMNIGTGGDVESGAAGIVNSVESIKTNCRRAFIDPLVAYSQVVEDLVEKVYLEDYRNSDTLTELLLLMFDEIRAAAEEIQFRHSLDVQLLDELRDKIKELLAVPLASREMMARDMLSTFAYRVHPDMVFRATEVVAEAPTIASGQKPRGLVNHREALAIFEGLAFTLDQKSPFTEHRTEVLRSLALAINESLDAQHRVAEEQLVAAVYLHDIGMALIPDYILNKKGKFNSDEIMILEQHPLHGYQLLSMMPNWQEAADMVYQHHERHDGKGYPIGITGDKICQGAKILAVVDTYYALTTQRADRPFKKSTLRTLTEINKFNGTQFDPVTVEALNEVIRNASHRA